jgi:thiamine biosynthesis protein ThiS
MVRHGAAQRARGDGDAMADAVISFELNGAPRTAAAGTTIAALLAELGAEPGRVAVERNLDVVPRAAYGDTILAAGDHIEVVGFVGGG